MFDKNNFPYAEYADQVEGIDWNTVEKEAPDLEQAKSVLYESAIRDYINQTKQDTMLDEYESTLKAEERFSDLRSTLGIPEKRSRDEQFKSINPDSFQSYLKAQNLEEKSLTIPIDTFIDGYVDTITDDKWGNPDLHKIPKAQVKARILANIPEDVSPDVETVGDFINRSFALKPETPVETANKAATEEEPSFLSSMGDALKRSLNNEDATDAASRIANPKPMEIISADPSAIPGEIGQLIEIDDPATIRSGVETAAQDLITAWDERKKIGESKPVQDLMKANDFNSAIKALFSDASLVPELLAESGVDMAQEIGAQVAGSVAGGIVGSEVPVIGTVAGTIAGGSAASAAAAKENAYNAFFEQQIKKYLEDKNLPATKESVMAFYDDKEAVQKAKDDASLSSSILAGGAFAASAVGGYLSVGPAAKIAARAGFKPIIKNGELVFERVTKGDVATSLLGATAAASAIGVGADYASRVSVDKEMTMGEFTGSVASNIVSGAVGAGIGYAVGKGKTGERAQVRVGDVLYDAEGKSHIVTTGDGNTITIYGDKGANKIDGAEVGKSYFQASPVDRATSPLTDNPASTDAESALRPTFDEARQSTTITKPDGNAAYVLNEAINAIQHRDKPPPTLPSDLVKTLDTELSKDGKGTPFTTLLSQLDDLTEVDGEQIYSENSYKLLANSLKSLTIRGDSGKFRPIITPVMNKDQVQARYWAAELQNYAIEKAKLKKPASIDEVLAGLENEIRVVQAEADKAADNDDVESFDALLKRQDEINQQIAEVNRYLGKDVAKTEAPIGQTIEPPIAKTESLPMPSDAIKPEIVGDSVDVADGFNGTEAPDELVGSYVDYYGSEGVLVKKDDGLYVLSQEGDVLIESGLSGKSIDELGIVPLEIDFDKVYGQPKSNNEPTILSDFAKNKFTYREKQYEYVGIEQADDGSKAIIANTAQGEERITNPQAILSLENQKIQYEVESTHDYTTQWEAIKALESDKAVRPLAPTPRAEPRTDTGKAEGSTGAFENTEQSERQNVANQKPEEPIATPPVAEVEQQKSDPPKPIHLIAVEKIRDKDLQNDLSDSNLFYLATRLPDELDISGTSLSPIAGSGHETKGGGRDGIQYRRNPSNNPDWFKTEKGAKEPTFKGINIDGDYINARYSAQDLKDAVQAIKQGIPPTRRQENILRGLVDVARSQLEDIRRQDEAELDAIFATVDVAETVIANPSKAYADELTNRLKTTLSEDDFEFFVTRNAELPDDQYIARALAVISDPTIKADLVAASSKAAVKPAIAAPVTKPVASTKIQFKPASEERSYNYTDSNFIPESLINQIKNDGYSVETVGNGEAIRGIKVRVGGDDTNPIIATISSRGAANPKEIKDRAFTVQIGTRRLPSYGGNKRFTIPNEQPVIKASSNNGEFIQSLMDAAEYAGFKVERSSSNEVRTIARGNEKYVIWNQEGKIFVDDQPIGERVSIQQAPITKQDKLDQALSKVRADNRAEYLFRNPSPKQETFLEQKERQFTKRLDYIDSPPDKASANSPVQLDLGSNPDLALRYARMDAAKALINPNPKGKTNYTKEDIQAYLDLLPEHISSLIRLHDTAQNPARDIGARGFFSNNYEGNGPQIHIDIHQDGAKTLEGIVSTLSEEVAHFVFDNWTTGTTLRHMSNFYDKAFKAYRAQIEGSLGDYIKHYGVDMNNPTTEHQYILVNELFSKQGTSFVDLIDNKAKRPTGLTDTEIAELKRIGREAQDSFVFDMTQTSIDKEVARHLAQEILKAQTAGVVGKQTVFDLKIDKGRTLRVIPTAIGQYRSVVGSPESQKISRRLNRSHHPLLRFLYSNALTGNKLMNREILRIISNAASLDSEHNRKLLQSNYENSRMVEAILKRYGINNIEESSFKDGVRAYFEKLGIKKSAYLKVADEADSFMKEGMDVIVHRVEDIRNELDGQIALLRQQGNLQGVDPLVLSQMINDLEVTKSKFKADWLHRRYRAYEDPSQLAIFEEMLKELRGDRLKDGSLWEQKQKAEAEIRNIRAKTSLSDIEKDQRIAEQKAIASKYDRLMHLHKKFHYQNNKGIPTDNRQYVAEVKDYLEKLLSKTRDYQGANFTKVDNIKSMQKRSLDWDAPENTSDFHEIAFLDPITNPIENIVFSIYQQNEVIRALQANRLLANELLVGLGGDIAHIKGSMDHTDVGSDYLSIGQESSILKHISIREPLARAMKEQIEVQGQLNRSWIQSAISTAKIGQTVLNPGTAINNYYGIPFLLFGNGHLLYVNRWLASSRGISEAWKSRNHIGSNGDAYHKMIVREMQDLRVLGTGLNAGTLDINYQGSLYQKALQRLTDGFSALGRDDLKINSRAKVDKTFELVHDFYKFSDDAPKILSYMIERDKAELKWKAMLKREDFDSTENYEKELARLIKREAADKTLRQYTDWAAMPDLLKKATHNQFRVFMGDYITFVAQMAKSMVESTNILKEDFQDYAAAKAGGHTEWQSAIQRAIMARSIGMTGIYSGIAFGASSGLMLLPIIANSAFSTIADMMGYDPEASNDDDLMSSKQRSAHSRLLAYDDNFKGGAKFEPLAVKEGDYVIAINAMRPNPFSSFTPFPTPSTGVELSDQTTNFVRNLVMGGGNTIGNQLINAYNSKDRYGNELEDGKLENMSSIVTNLATPGIVKNIYEASTGQSWYTEKFKDETFSIAGMAGISAKRVHVPSIATRIGYEAQHYKTTRDLSKQLIADLKTGSGTLSQQAIVTSIQREVYANQKKMRRYNAFITDWTDAGYTKAEAIKYATYNSIENKATPFRKDDATKLFNGVDIFSLDTLKDLNKALAEAKKKPVSKESFPQEFKERAVKNIEFAISQYKKVLPKYTH